MKRCNVLTAALIAAVITVNCAGCSSSPAPVTAADTSPTEVTVAAVQTPMETQAVAAAQSESGGEVPVSRYGLLKCNYYDDREFCDNVEKSVIYKIDAVPQCGVAPHHLAAGHFIAGMYRTAAEKREQTDTVVLLAPMHYDGKNTLATSLKGWETAFGTAECDTETAELFIDRLGAKADDEMLQYDHSASTHIPFIKRYFPDSKVVCLLVSPKELPAIPEKLSKLLYELSEQKNCFFAFSIDFSHYLDPDEADRHDKETLEAVLNGNTKAIERFTNANVDTPYCLNTFVELSGLLGSKIKKADNSNTLRVGDLPYTRGFFPEGVTSYFVFFS